MRAKLAAVMLALVTGCNAEASPPLNASKIIPPPGGGVYLGQHQWRPNDMATFEAAAGQGAASFGNVEYNTDLDVMFWDDVAQRIAFNVAHAENAWLAGKMVFVFAYEATPEPNPFIPGFTVDRLLSGEFDADLSALAAEFRAFGKPMFFQTSREPNGVGVDFGLGGFGPDGSKNFDWALANGGLADFDPSGLPNAGLYADLGDPTVSDGVERLIAAQRYYYHFFVEQEGCDFLTFDSMGWAANPFDMLVTELGLTPGDPAWRLYETTFSFQYFWPGDAYVDWISLTWYMTDWGQLPPHATQWHIDRLRGILNEIHAVTSNKPVFIIEMGLFEGSASENPTDKATNVTAGLTELLSHPEIAGFSMWSQSPDVPDFDFLIRPGTPDGDAFHAIVSANPGKFHSCAWFTGGTQMPACVAVSVPAASTWSVPTMAVLLLIAGTLVYRYRRATTVAAQTTPGYRNGYLR